MILERSVERTIGIIFNLPTIFLFFSFFLFFFAQSEVSYMVTTDMIDNKHFESWDVKCSSFRESDQSLNQFKTK